MELTNEIKDLIFYSASIGAFVGIAWWLLVEHSIDLVALIFNKIKKLKIRKIN